MLKKILYSLFAIFLLPGQAHSCPYPQDRDLRKLRNAVAIVAVEVTAYEHHEDGKGVVEYTTSSYPHRTVLHVRTVKTFKGPEREKWTFEVPGFYMKGGDDRSLEGERLLIAAGKASSMPWSFGWDALDGDVVPVYDDPCAAPFVFDFDRLVDTDRWLSLPKQVRELINRNLVRMPKEERQEYRKLLNRPGYMDGDGREFGLEKLLDFAGAEENG